MARLSVLAENYLKVIWNAREWTDEDVTIGLLASRLGLAPSSVSEAIRKLTDAGLVSHARYGAVELTETGRLAALGMVRKHRLIETFLVDYLGYGWDEVHHEAEVLEHAVSDHFIERLATRLGEPLRDPHGDPIPRSDGTLPELPAIPLSDAKPGSTVTVGQVSDSDSELLRHLDRLGIGLDSHLTVRARHDSIGTMTVEHDGALHDLGLVAAAEIRVLLVRESTASDESLEGASGDIA